MKVLVLNGLGQPLTLEASRVLITTASGTPMALAVELLPDVLDLSTVEDDDFNLKLRTHGIDRTVQLGQLRAPRITDFDFTV